MKMKQLAIACAAALALPLAAHATAPTGPNDTAGAMVIYLSGASAPDNFLASIATSMLQSGYYSYIDGGSTSLPGKAYTAFLGYAASGSGLPTTQKVLLIKRSAGGSVWGVNPVARNHHIATMSVDASCTLVSGNLYKCPTVIGVDPVGATDGTGTIPDFGASDVAPSMFKDPFNVEAGQTQLSSGEAGVLNSTTFPVQAVAMGYVATAAIPDTAYLSHADYGSMLSGTIYDWSQLGLAPAGGNQVVVCRRVPGSGTQASYNWNFNNFPCTGASATSGVDGVSTPARMLDSAAYNTYHLGNGSGSSTANAIGIDVTAGYTVIENSGSGDVRTCLQKANNGGLYQFKDENNKWHEVNFGSGGYGAIGVLSLDSQESTSAGAESAWFFRPIDGAGVFHYATQTCTSGAGAATGVCPSKQNLLQDKYAFLVESTMQYRSGANAVDAAKKPFIDKFIANAGGDAYQKNWTVALPLDSNGLTPTFDTVDTQKVVNNVARGTHAGNMCKQLSKLY